MFPLSPVKVKTNGEYYQIFQEVLNQERYKKVVEQLVLKAEGGDLKAQRLIIEQAQGRPVQRIEVVSRQDSNLERIQKLLEDAGQPVEWAVLEETEILSVDNEEE